MPPRFARRNSVAPLRGASAGFARFHNRRRGRRRYIPRFRAENFQPSGRRLRPTAGAPSGQAPLARRIFRVSRVSRVSRFSPATGLEVLRAEARDVPTAFPPSVMEAGGARACAASAARPNSAERSEAAEDSLHWAGSSPRGSAGGTDDILANQPSTGPEVLRAGAREPPSTGLEVLRAEARDVPTASLPTSPPLGRKFSARRRGMYRRRPRRRLGKRAKPAPAPRQRRD